MSAKYVSDYKFEYLHNLRTVVIPYLKKYETERIGWLILSSVIGALIFGIAFGILYWYFSKTGQLRAGITKLALWVAGGAFVVWKFFQSHFEYKLKGAVMPTLMEALPGFEWDFEPEEDWEQKILDTKIFPYAKKIKQYYFDNFVGYYREVYMNFSSGYYQAARFLSGQFEFNGPVIRIKMNKPFVGATVLRPNDLKDKDCSDLKRAGLQKIELEDMEFNKKFLIYSTDQIEARYLLTTGFMERFKNIAKAYKSSRIFCSFYDEYLYIAPYTKEDVFSLFGLTKPLTDIRPYNVIFEQVASVLSMVDYLKLDQQLGL